MIEDSESEWRCNYCQDANAMRCGAVRIIEYNFCLNIHQDFIGIIYPIQKELKSLADGNYQVKMCIHLLDL